MTSMICRSRRLSPGSEAMVRKFFRDHAIETITCQGKTSEVNSQVSGPVAEACVAEARDGTAREGFQLSLSTCAGSIRDARQAGSPAATAATMAKTRVLPMSVVGSLGWGP